MKGCAVNPECGVRESECFASPVWQSKSGWVPVWATSPRGDSVWPALTGGGGGGGGCLEVCLHYFSLFAVMVACFCRQSVPVHHVMMQQVSVAPPPPISQLTVTPAAMVTHQQSVSSQSLSDPPGVWLPRPPPLLLIALPIAAANCSLPLVSFLHCLSKLPPPPIYLTRMLSSRLFALHLHIVCLLCALSLLSHTFTCFFLSPPLLYTLKIFSRHLHYTAHPTPAVPHGRQP